MRHRHSSILVQREIAVKTYKSGGGAFADLPS